MNKISYKGKAKFKDGYVYKEDKDNNEIHKFLSSKDFNYYLPYISRENGVSKYLKIDDINYNLDNKAYDLITILALLHNKTSYQKTTNKENVIQIKNGIISYINYLEAKYNEMLEIIITLDYPSPSETLFLRYYSKISAALSFIRELTKDWYNLVENENKTRICLIHNNISINHFINSKEKYLISWDKSTFDTPIKDIIDLYHELWDKLDFEYLLNRYIEKCKLNNSEIKLLIINLAIPKLFKKDVDEYINTKNMTNIIEYINNTEELIKPYLA